MKEISVGQIDPGVFNCLLDTYFQTFIAETYIGGGSSALKGAKVEQEHIDATSKLIKKLRLKRDHKYLHIVGLSSSGKSEIRKKLLNNISYFPLDEILKVFIDNEEVKSFSLFQTEGKFDAKKFEYAMYCAAFTSGMYSGHIIGHSGSSPLQPGIQALSEGLAGDENHSIHLSVDGKIIADNIASSVLYNSWESVKEPVIDSIGIELGAVKKGYEKIFPARDPLVAYEKNESNLLGSLRKRYRNFCDANKELKSTTERIGWFGINLISTKYESFCSRHLELKTKEERLASFDISAEKEELNRELKMLKLHQDESYKYVLENEWRRSQFDTFSKRTKICNTVEDAAELISNYLSRSKKLVDISVRLNAIIAKNQIKEVEQTQNLSAVETENDVFLFDMHGVIHSGGEIPQKTLDYLEHLKKSGKTVVIASNDTNSGEKYTEILKGKGLIEGVHFNFAVTSGDVFDNMVKDGIMEQEIKKTTTEDLSKRKIKIFVQDELAESSIFENSRFEKTEDIDKADAVLTGSPRSKDKRIKIEEEESYLKERKNNIDIVIKKKLPVIVPNPDLENPFENERFGVGYRTIGAGRFAKECEEGTQVKVIRTGKPSSQYYDYLKQRLGEIGKTDYSKVVMVGDSFATDIIGAKAAGFKTVAVANEKSNIGIMIAKNETSFVEQLKQKDRKPNIFIQNVW